MAITRKATYENINEFLKKAQEDVDEDIPAEGDEPGEEVEELEEEEGEEEAPPKDLEERVEDLEETQEELTDALEEHTEIIEQVLEGGEGEETLYEDFIEDQEGEEDEDEISSDEMGLEDLLTATKEETMSLRDQRKARLRQAAESPADTETISDQWDFEKDRKKRSGPIQPEVPKGNVPKHEMPEIFKVSDLSLEQTPDKQAWVLLDKNEKPICALRKGSIPEKEFTSSAFAKKVILDMHKNGIKATLKKYKAVKYVKKAASADPAVAEKAAKEKVVANNDFKRRFIRAFRLALTAMNKNLVEEIPLKAAFFDILSDLEVPQANEIIETAFKKGAIKHFEAAIAQAEKYLGMSDASLIEYEARINDTKVADLSINEPQRVTASDHAMELRRRASENSLPFSSSTDEDLTDKVAALERIVPKPKLYNSATMFKGSNR